MSNERNRLDEELARRGLTVTRSQAENLVKLGHVKVGTKIIRKPSYNVRTTDKIKIANDVQYVSRAALKLKSAAESFSINFKGKTMLDVGISTGGFTDYALVCGAEKVIGVDVGTNQIHPTLRDNPKIDLHEKLDIRDYIKPADLTFDLVTIDVSFISMRDILPQVLKLASQNTQIIAMLKPQFEVGGNKKHKGVIKNDRMRRDILHDFEHWLQDKALIVDTKDSDVSGKKGNVERFYLLELLKR